jgi:hypothetical protein
MTTLQMTASVPIRRFDLLEASGEDGSAEVRDRLQSNIRALYTYYVHGPLQGTYDREFEQVRINATSLAAASGRDVLVRGDVDPGSGLGPLYEWRLPKLLAYVQLLGGTQVAAVDQDIAFVHVFDYSTPHPYGAETFMVDDESGAGGERYAGEMFDGRSIEFDDLGDKVDGLYLYSQEAGRTWRRLGAQYRWPDAYFLKTGEIHVWIAPRVFILKLHDRSGAVTAGKHELSAHCRGFPDEAYRASPCWPERYSD